MDADKGTTRSFDQAVLERHPLSTRFHEILEDLGELHDKKQNDYGAENDPFANVRGSKEFGVPPWVGALVRANDKMKRLQTQATKGSLSNESAEDSFMDLAVYAIIGLVLFEQEQREGKSFYPSFYSGSLKVEESDAT